MPVIIRCDQCGSVLEEFDSLPPELWYEHLHTKLGGKCPNCGHKLQPPRPGRVKVLTNPMWPPLPPVVYNPSYLRRKKGERSWEILGDGE